MTLALPKTGLDAATVGDLWLADIGIPAEVYRRIGVDSPVAVFAGRYRVRLRPEAGSGRPGSGHRVRERDC